MLRNYIKIAFRSLVSNKLFTTVNVLGLTIGMTATLLISIWVQNELSFDRYHQDSDRIYRLISHVDVGKEVWQWASVPFPTAGFMEDIPEIEETVMATLPYSAVIIGFENGEILEEKAFAYVEPKWFEFFEQKILEGSSKNFDKSIQNIMLTESGAKRYFGQQTALGKQVFIDSTAYTVCAILEDNPSNSSFQFNTYAPFQAQFSEKNSIENAQKDWGNFNHMAFAKIIEKADPEMIASKITQIFDENKENNNTQIELEALSAMRFNQSLMNNELKIQNKAAVYIFALIGFIILLTAALNYINLSTALIGKRVREIGIKKIIGASYKHIFSQTMLETLLISCLAFGMGLTICWISLPLLSTYIDLPLELTFDRPIIWLLFLGLVAINLIIAGIYPSTLFAGFKPVRLLKGLKSSTKEGFSLRKVLVVVQFTLASLVLMSTLVIQQQLHHVQTMEVGYSRDQIIDISPDLFSGNWEYNFKQFALFEEELKKVPEFEQVVGMDGSIVNITGSNGGNFNWEGKVEDFNAVVSTFSTNEDFQDIFDLEMKAGRWFSADFETDKNHIILNETAVKAFNIPEPVIGRKVKFRKEGEIIGVVKDFHFKSAKEAINPLLINYNDGWAGNIMAKVSAGNTQIALTKAEQKFKEILPTVLFKYSFLDEGYQQLYENERKMSALFQIFAALLIFISCLGLFGLATFNVERRTKEIGIRKVLGASATRIVQLLSKDFLKLVFIALVIASPIAWYLMNRWLQNYAYRIDLQWWIFAVAGVLAIGVALLTVSSQSMKAAFSNPTESLRNE